MISAFAVACDTQVSTNSLDTDGDQPIYHGKTDGDEDGKGSDSDVEQDIICPELGECSSYCHQNVAYQCESSIDPNGCRSQSWRKQDCAEDTGGQIGTCRKNESGATCIFEGVDGDVEDIPDGDLLADGDLDSGEMDLAEAD